MKSIEQRQAIKSVRAVKALVQEHGLSKSVRALIAKGDLQEHVDLSSKEKTEASLEGIIDWLKRVMGGGPTDSERDQAIYSKSFSAEEKSAYDLTGSVVYVQRCKSLSDDEKKIKVSDYPIDHIIMGIEEALAICVKTPELLAKAKKAKTPEQFESFKKEVEKEFSKHAIVSYNERGLLRSKTKHSIDNIKEQHVTIGTSDWADIKKLAALRDAIEAFGSSNSPDKEIEDGDLNEDYSGEGDKAVQWLSVAYEEYYDWINSSRFYRIIIACTGNVAKALNLK